MDRILKHGSSRCGGHYLHLVDDILFFFALPPSATAVVLKFTSRTPEETSTWRRFKITARVVKHGGERKKEGERNGEKGEMRFHPNDVLKRSFIVATRRMPLALFLGRRSRPFHACAITRAKNHCSLNRYFFFYQSYNYTYQNHRHWSQCATFISLQK